MPATQVAPDARTILPALGRAASINSPLSPGLERASLPRTLTSSWGRPYLATGHAGHTDMAPHPECGNSVKTTAAPELPMQLREAFVETALQPSFSPAQAHLLPSPSTAAELPAR